MTAKKASKAIVNRKAKTGEAGKSTKKSKSAKKVVKRSATARAGAQKSTQSGVEDAVKRLKLKNGLSVLLLENHKSPVVSVQMWVKTGSADEQKGEEGISHFIEHLVFKGTNKYDVGAIASTVEASGGELNAYTSFDQTVFYVNISREFSDVALDVIGEMMGFPRFDEGEINNEREVVLEEIKRSNDSPGRQASRLLFSSIFKKHPYGIPVIGYDNVIRDVSRETLVDYYQSRYVPKNMHLVVAGDFEMDEMSERIEKTFGRLKTFKLRKSTRTTEPKQTSARIRVQKSPFEEAQFHIAWRVPGASHKDVAALDVLALIIGQGDSSRLSKRLRMEAPVTNSIGAGTFTPKDLGLFTISAALNAEQIETAFAGVQEELTKIVAEPPTGEELAKAIVNLESEEFYAMETIEGVARKAGSFENLMGDHAYFRKFLKLINKLTPEDIQKAARKYFDPSAMTIVLLTPRNEDETEAKLKTWLKGYTKAFSKAKLHRPKKGATKRALKKKLALTASGNKETGEIEKHVLDSGTTVLFRESSATPVFSAKAAFLGGLRAEPENETGVTELLSRVWTSGTKRFSEAELLLKIENMAGGLSAFGGRNSAGLSMQTISPFEDEALDLFMEALTEPVIDAAAVEREKTIMMEAIRSREDSPGQLVSQLFLSKLFAGHPYERDLYGTKETVQRLDTKKANTHLARMSQSKNMTVVVTGDIDRDKWIDALEKASKSMPKGKSFTSNFEHRGPKKDSFEFMSLKREQTHIITGHKGLTFTDPGRYTLQVIQSILAGQGGRLFIELRDKASLAYSVSPMRMEGLDTGYFGAYIACSPQKGEKAIAMLKEEFKKLCEVKVGEAELERAKRYLIGRHDIDLQRSSSIGSAILFNEIYGVEAKEIFEYADRLREVTAEGVMKMSQEIFSRPAITCAVGSDKPW